jgi:propanol-preferring alcohol dehydrogenase
VGDRVGIKWMSAVCNTCTACLSGRDASCLSGKISGYYTPGTFQQYATAPASYVTPIPEGLDSASAAPQLCAGVTVYAALQKADVKAGQFVVIMGAGGGLGHLACALASKGLGARVIGIDHGSKKAVADESGVEFFIDFTQTKDVTAEVMKITGGLGAHATLVLTASNAAYAQSLTFLRFGGTAVCVGVPEGDMVPVASAAPALFIFKELRLVGSAVGGRLQAIETLDFAARGVIKTHYKTAKLEDLAQVFQDMEEGKIQGRVVLEID